MKSLYLNQHETASKKLDSVAILQFLDRHKTIAVLLFKKKIFRRNDIIPISAGRSPILSVILN